MIILYKTESFGKRKSFISWIHYKVYREEITNIFSKFICYILCVFVFPKMKPCDFNTF